MADPISATVAFAVSAWTSAVTATAGALATIGTVGAIGEGATIALAGGILKTGAMLSLSAASAALLRPKTPSSGTTLDFKPDPKAPVRGAMGYTALGGNKVFQATWGYNRVAMSLGVALSLGPIDAITQFRADDAVVTFAGAQQEATGFYAADMWQRTTLGLPTDAALLPPTGLKYGNPGLTGWGSQNAAPGTAFAFWTMVLAKNPQDRDVFTNGVPDPRWIGRWMKVWQPRYDSTYPGGSGPQRRDDWRTWGWSENPYDHALAWVRGHYKMNADGSLDRTKRIAGIGAPDAAIDIPAFVEGMNVADANGWTISGEWSTTDGKFQTLIAMLQAGGGEPISRGALISVMVNAPRVSTYTYTRDDLIGSAEIRPLTPRRERKNTITPRYRSEANGWEYVPAGEVTSTIYRDEDRGEPRSLEIEYVHVRDARQAGQLAAYDLANLREGLTATLPSKAHLMHVHPGDCITVDVPELALAGQKFIVRRATASHQSASVTLELRSESDAKHAWALGQAAQPAPSPSLSAVDPKYVAPPEPEFWAVLPKPPSGGTEQPILIIEGEVGTADVSAVLVEYGLSATGPWEVAYSGAPLTEGLYPTPGLNPGQAYWISVRHIAKNGALSDRLIDGPHTAPGLKAGDVIPTAPSLVAIDDRIDDAFGELAGVQVDLDNAADLIATQGVEIAAARGGQPNLGARIAQVVNAQETGDQTNADLISLVEARRNVLALAVGNNDFSQGVEGWSTTSLNDPGAAPIPLSAWVPQATFQGLSNVLVPAQATGVSGTNRNLMERKRWAIDPTRKYQIRARIHVGSAGSGSSQVYIGGQMMDGAGAPAGGNSGRRYFAVNGTSYAAGAGWVDVLSPVLTGTATSITAFDPATKQLSLLFYQNQANNASAPPIAIDELTLLDVTDRETAAAAVLTVQSALVDEQVVRASEVGQVSARLARAPLANVPFDNLGTGYFASSTSTNTSQVAGAPEGRSNPAQFASMNMVSTANGWVSRFSSARRVLTQAVMPLPVGRVIEIVTEWNVTTPPSGSAGTGRFAMIGLNGDFTYFANDTSANFTFPAGVTGRVTHKSRWARSGHGLAGVNSVSGTPVNVRPAVDVTTFNGMVADLVGVSVLDVTEEAGLSATVTQQSLALIDLETQQALAKFELVAAASGGRPAIFRMVSGSLGTAIALGADFIYFGDNTVFDDATDTLQTTVGPNIRVLALGAPFGAGSNLVEWWGPTGIGLSAMTTGNGLNGRMTTAPYVFDNVTAMSSKRSLIAVSARAVGSSDVTMGDKTLTGVINGPDGVVVSAFFDITSFLFVPSSESVTVYAGEMLLYEMASNGSGSTLLGTRAFSTEGEIENVSITTVGSRTGTVRYRVVMRSTNFESATIGGQIDLQTAPNG